MDSGTMITVGVLTPHTTPGADVELPTMAPTQIRVTTSRTLPTRNTTSPSPEAGCLDAAASSLVPAADVLAFASTGSGYALGYDEESALMRRLQERCDVPTYSTCSSAVAALRSRNIERISLVHPPWFGRPLNDLGAKYFRSQGFEVVDAQLADLPDDPNQIRPAMVVEWVAQHLCDRAEAVFLGGNGFRAAHAIHDLEHRTGRLVLEANQVLLWSVLEQTGAPVASRGFGTLLDDRRPDENNAEES